MPRLELLSSLLAIRLGEAVRKALHIEHWKITYWSDSLVALGWIRGEPSRWRPFVKNQVETIQSVSKKEWWRHCPGLQNPADLASRGAPAPALVNSQLWWNGPEWLKLEEEKWPDPPDSEQHDSSVQNDIESESRGAVANSAAAITVNKRFEWSLERISTWNRLLRRTAWIFRFIHRFRKKKRYQGIGLTEVVKIKDYNKDKSKRKPDKEATIARMSGEELDEAELFIYRQLQMETYPKAFESLQMEGPVHPKEKIAHLHPVWDPRDKFIRITGRVSLALRDKDIEPPILLPANHPVVSFIITDRHQWLMHAGVKTTLSELKERFWIIKGRQQVKKSWFACVTCRKLSSPPFQELAAPLPLNRLKKVQAFNVTGPLYCKKDPKKQDTDDDYMAEDGNHG